MSEEELVENNHEPIVDKKKKKKKKTKQVDDESAKIQVKASLDEIDQLFANAKKKRKETAIAKEIEDEIEKKREEEEEKQRKKKAKKFEEYQDEGYVGAYGVIKSEYNIAATIISPEAPIHRWDGETGLPVYKAAALKVGEGGGTPLCPFDCDCCF